MKISRRVVATVAVYGLVATALRIGIFAPERCPAVTVSDLRAGVRAASTWIVEAQKPDGRFVYEYDRSTGEEVPGYNNVRHAGVVMSLFQLLVMGRAQADPRVVDVAERGLGFIEANLVGERAATVSTQPWAAFAPGNEDPKLGATALVVASLSYRRTATGRTDKDELLKQMGQFLLRQQRSDGSFLAFAARSTGQPVPGITSLYSTGEAFFGLTLLENLFPDEPWDVGARRAALYVSTERDAKEFPRWGPWGDQWAAYAYEQMKTWGLTKTDVAYVRRLSGRFGLMTRGESQRRESGVQHLLRRGPARGGGFGTVVEALASLHRLAEVEPQLADLAAPLRERSRCAAGIAFDRQQTAGDAQGFSKADPKLVIGAWYKGTRTRMDDQQHVLSGMVASQNVLVGDS